MSAVLSLSTFWPMPCVTVTDYTKSQFDDNISNYISYHISEHTGLLKQALNIAEDEIWNYVTEIKNGGEKRIPRQFAIFTALNIVRGTDIFVNCNWVFTRWQKYSTHLHKNNIFNDTKQTIHRKAQQFWKSAGRAPSWLVISWHLPYNREKITEKPQLGQPRLRIRRQQ